MPSDFVHQEKTTDHEDTTANTGWDSRILQGPALLAQCHGVSNPQLLSQGYCVGCCPEDREDVDSPGPLTQQEPGGGAQFLEDAGKSPYVSTSLGRSEHIKQP